MTLTVKEVTDQRAFKVGHFIFNVNPTTGLVSVISYEWDLMNGSHYWNSRGDQSLWEFIVGLKGDRHYTTKKLFVRSAVEEIDDDETHRAIFAFIRESVRDGSLTRAQATECLEHLQSCQFDTNAPTELRDYVDDFPHLEAVYEFIRHKERHCVGVFWEAWTAFCDHVRDVVIPDLQRPNPTDQRAASAPVHPLVGQSICPVCNKPIEEGNMSSTGYIDYCKECNLVQ